MPHTIKVFEYVPEVDAFKATCEYREIADTLGLAEWNPVVWIGRLFMLDNDYGEHWFDNERLRKDRGLSEEFFVIEPERFKNDADGPCNTPGIRKQFWTDVLKSLELSLDLLFEKARQLNARTHKWIEESPERRQFEDMFISDLDERIADVRNRYERP